ncbi:MAG: type VII secretion-associated protein [Corynebacterium sp.]|nr:type VII secretion-associated protein [Corynebacterium sp.]
MVTPTAISPEDVSLHNEVFVAIDTHGATFHRPGNSAEPIYRPDLPATGVVEGWAVPAIISQLTEMMAGQWPDIEVIIDAGERETELLARTLVNRGVGAYPQSLLTRSSAPTAESTTPERGVDHPAGRWRDGVAIDGGVLGMIAAVVLLAVVLIASVVVVTRMATGSDAQPEPSPVAITPITPVTSDIPTPTPSPEPPPPVQVTNDQFSVSLPAGFTISQRPDGAYSAVGPDPELRILLASDPVSGVDAVSFVEEMKRVVEGDPTLSLAEAEVPQNGGVQMSQRPHINYIELPGDGSQIAWASWVDGDRQFSVGCHSRRTPTPAHASACAVAEASLGYPHSQ